MNLLFLTLFNINSVYENNLYSDLLREFVKRNHKVFVVSPIERRNKTETYIVKEEGATVLRLKTGNIQKTNIIEKGISTLSIESEYIKGIKKYFKDIKFDAVLYSTPPITLCKAINYVKKRDNAKSYLLLKDIFPQNSVDLGMLSKSGIKGLLYKFFRNKEKRLYGMSDFIGCMSPANVEYLLKNNSEISSERVEVCPNCAEPIDLSVSSQTKRLIREKYHLPINKKIFVYGGNLGKPQGIDFLIECLYNCNRKDAFFLIIGSGTEFEKLNEYVQKESPEKVKLLTALPKSDYDTLIAACDVGMIFLDHRFTIPNFPSRLLTYLQAKLPVLVVSDPNCDMGEIAEKNEFGFWSESNSVKDFCEKIENIMQSDNLELIGNNGYIYLKNNYDSSVCCDRIIKSLISL